MADTSSQSQRKRLNELKAAARKARAEGAKKARRLANKEVENYGFSKAEESTFLSRHAAGYATAVRKVEMTPNLRAELRLLSSQGKNAERAALANFAIITRSMKEEVASGITTMGLMGAGGGAGLAVASYSALGAGAASGGGIMAAAAAAIIGLTFEAQKADIRSRVRREYEARRRAAIVRAHKAQRGAAAPRGRR